MPRSCEVCKVLCALLFLVLVFFFPHPEGKEYFQGKCSVRELVLREEDLMFCKDQLGLCCNLLGKLIAGRSQGGASPSTPLPYKEQG